MESFLDVIGTAICGVIGAVLFIVIYFLPFILACSYRKHQSVSIFIVNLFFGWTLIGWVICLAWSVAGDSEKC